MAEEKKAEKVPTDAELAGTADTEPDPPVYDERGNVRPRGTEGAKPMSYEERVAIAERIQKQDKKAGLVEDEPEPESEKPAKKAAAKKAATGKKAGQ